MYTYHVTENLLIIKQIGPAGWHWAHLCFVIRVAQVVMLYMTNKMGVAMISISRSDQLFESDVKPR